MTPLARITTTAIITAALAVSAEAQHAGHGSHGSHAAGGEGHRAAQACATQFERVVAEGRGFGMAFAADQNGYPGPMHVLELRQRLALTPEQASRIEELMHAMFAEAKPKSARLLEAEARLARLFAEGKADATAVRAATAEVERARTDVRLVHLLTHLRTRALLTESQRSLYHEARWGAR